MCRIYIYLYYTNVYRQSIRFYIERALNCQRSKVLKSTLMLHHRHLRSTEFYYFECLDHLHVECFCSFCTKFNENYFQKPASHSSPSYSAVVGRLTEWQWKSWLLCQHLKPHNHNQPRVTIISSHCRQVFVNGHKRK